MNISQKYINNKLKPPQTFFKWCLKQIPNFEWKNKNQTILASNRTDCEIITKRLTKRSNLSKPYKFYPFSIILVTSKRIEIQSYAFWSKVVDGKQTIDYYLSNFESFSKGRHIQAHSRGDKYYEGLVSNYGYMSGAYTNTRFFPNQWRERIRKISELKYLNLPCIERYYLENIYKYRKEIEFLQKIGAMVMANEIIYDNTTYIKERCVKSIDMRTVNINWLRKNKSLLKNCNKSFNIFRMEQLFKMRNGNMITGTEKYLYYGDLNRIPQKIGIIKFQRWIIKNNISFYTYLKYLKLLKKLEIPLESEIIIIPKDFNKAYSNALASIETLKKEAELKRKIAELEKNEAFEREYQKRFKNIKRLEKEIGEYTFVIPKNIKELIIEGTQLRHCVSQNRYLEKHRTGATTILFIRQKKSKDKPFYTLEYQDNKIIQIQGKYGKDPSKEITTVANKWLNLVS